MKSRENLKGKNVASELVEGQSPELLKALHLLTRDGSLNADARRKLKQVNHLYKLIWPAISDCLERYDAPAFVDVGAGKAYLGFIIYELALKNVEKGSLLSIESRADLMEKSQKLASELGFSRMQFQTSDIKSAKLPERVHLVTALHACDTATDEAIAVGLKVKADYIAVVPCCQAEVARLLKDSKSLENKALFEHGIHRREFGSHLTNVIRCLTLESLGYQVTVTELVGWEHSLKNEFILAKKVNAFNKQAQAKLDALLNNYEIKPYLTRSLNP